MAPTSATTSAGTGLLSKVSRILTGKAAAQPLDRSALTPGVNAFKAVIPAGRHWTTTEFSVGPGDADLRLDRLITSRYDVPRPLLQKLLRKRMIRLERPDYVSEAGRLAEPGQIVNLPVSGALRVQPGDVISLSEVFLQERRAPSQLRLEEITDGQLQELHALILHRDADLLVLNKPPGLAVHGGPGTEEHVERFLAAFQFEAAESPRLIHRLDKGTSGVLMLARSRQAAARLAARFQEGGLEKSVRKYYWAMVNGAPPVKQGRLVTNIYQADRERQTSIADKRIGIYAVLMYLSDS